jgi:hypothetical protein
MNKNCIIIFAIDDGKSKFNHSDYYNVTKQAWESYCRKYNIDFIFVDKLTDNIPHPKWNKHCAFDYVDGYEKIGMMDFDTMPNWSAPNFFDQYTDEFCGVIDNESINWLTNSITSYRQSFNELNVPISLCQYINSGVLFFTKNHKYVDFRFNTMRLIKNDWLQHNWQLNENNTPFFIKYSYIWHFTGCSIEERNGLINQIWDQTKQFYK